MMAAASSDGQLLRAAWRSPRPSGRRAARAPASGPSSLSASIASRLLRSTSSVNAACAILVGQLAEDLREVGRMLLLQQVQQVGGGADAQQALDRVEHDVEFALGHRNCPM